MIQQKLKEWLDSLEAVVEKDGTDRAHYLLKKLIDEAYKEGSNQPLTRITPYINTIPVEAEIKIFQVIKISKEK